MCWGCEAGNENRWCSLERQGPRTLAIDLGPEIETYKSSIDKINFACYIRLNYIIYRANIVCYWLLCVHSTFVKDTERVIIYWYIPLKATLKKWVTFQTYIALVNCVYYVIDIGSQRLSQRVFSKMIKWLVLKLTSWQIKVWDIVE